MLKKLPKLSLLPRTRVELTTDYVVAKYYEYGYKVSHNKYSDIYNSCCPLCHEGTSWGAKKRSFYLPEQNKIFCHNCGTTLDPYGWIKKVSGMSDYELMQDYRESDTAIDFTRYETRRTITNTLPVDCINLFDKTQVSFYKNHWVVKIALEYIARRRLDVASNRPKALYLSLKDQYHRNRIIIPFYDACGEIIFYQSRKILDDETPNYLSKMDADKSLGGVENVDESDTVFIFEGPLDSFFIKNGVSLAGINKGMGNFTPLQTEQMEELKFYRKIWFLDSQWKDETSRVKTEKLLSSGEEVFIWPAKWGKRYKDLNELCMAHRLNEISPEFVKNNTQKGLSGVLRMKRLLNN